jgi:hypothetical protein
MNTKGSKIMGKSLNEFIEKYSSVQLLEKNLRANLDMLTHLPEDDKDALMRMNLIMIRQCLEDFGAE